MDGFPNVRRGPIQAGKKVSLIATLLDVQSYKLVNYQILADTTTTSKARVSPFGRRKGKASTPNETSIPVSEHNEASSPEPTPVPRRKDKRLKKQKEVAASDIRKSDSDEVCPEPVSAAAAKARKGRHTPLGRSGWSQVWLLRRTSDIGCV